MANKVLLKKSSVAARIPTTSDLDYGELALNYADGKLYYKTATNTIKSFADDTSAVTLAGTQTLTNKTLTTPTLTGTTTFTGVYHTSYLTQYGSLFIEGTSTNNIVQVSSHGVTEGVGLWSNGVSGILYANAGLYFKVGTTLRDQDIPTGGTIALTIGNDTNATFAKSVQLNAQGELRLADADSSNYVGFKSPATVTSNLVWTLPATDGTTGQQLSTNGSGVLSWADAGSGGSGGYTGLVEISETGISTSTTLYSASATTYRGAKYTIQITNSTAYAMYEFLVMHDGTGIYFPYSSSAYAGDSSGNFQNYFHGDYLDSIALTKIQVGNTYHAFNWAVTGGNLVFSASCSSGTISVKGAVLLIRA